MPIALPVLPVLTVDDQVTLQSLYGLDSDPNPDDTIRHGTGTGTGTD